MPLHIPLITKICSVIVIMIALFIVASTLRAKETEDRTHRRQWLILSCSCLIWGILVWVPLLTENAIYRNAIHMARLVFLMLGGWAFIGLYQGGQLGLKKRPSGSEDN